MFEVLDEVLRLTQGDLSNVIKEEKDETDRNNKDFYKDYQGESHD